MRIDVFDSLTAVEDLWRRFQHHADCYAFQSYEWLSGWFDALGKAQGYEPRVVVVTDESPIMLLPLAIRRIRGVSVLCWLGGPLSDYQGPVLSHDFDARLNSSFNDLWNRIQDRIGGFDVVRLEKQPSRIADQINPMLTLPHHPAPDDSHYTEILGPWPDFYATKRSSKSRSTDRRKRRRLEERGTVRIECPVPMDNVEPVMDALREQKSRAYQDLGVEDLFADTQVSDFLLEMTRNPKTADVVHLSALWLDNQVLATHWGMVWKDRLYYMLPTYQDGPLSRFSPGVHLLHELMNWCIANGITTFDFTLGSDPYKAHWCDQSMPMTEHVRAATARGLVGSATSQAQTWLKHKIKESDAAYEAARKLRKALRR